MSVTIPMNQVIQFLNENDLNSGKTYPGFYKITVISEEPWEVSVMAKTPFFSSASQDPSNNMPVSIMSVKESTTSNFISLSVTPQNLLTGSSTTGASNFYIDLRVDPSWNYKGGNYYQDLTFTLSSQ